jgi:hypothetical protein
LLHFGFARPTAPTTHVMSSNRRPLLTARHGPPVFDTQALRGVGERGPATLQNHAFIETGALVPVPVPQRGREAVNKQNNPAVPAQ